MDLEFEDRVMLACAAARDNRDDLAGKLIASMVGDPASAAPQVVSLELFSNEELLAELRQRMAAMNMVLRVVPNQPVTIEPAEEAPAEPAPKKRGRPRKEEPAAEAVEEQPAAEPEPEDPFAEPKAEPVTIDQVVAAGTALRNKDGAVFLDTMKKLAFTNIKQVDPGRYAEIKAAFDAALADLED